MPQSDGLVHSAPAEMKILLMQKNSSKTEVKPFPYCAISHEIQS